MDNRERNGKSLILFKDVHETMKAEQILKRRFHDVKVVAPPPDVRTGCDLSIEIDIVDVFGAEKALRDYRVLPLKIVSLNGIQNSPLEIVSESDFGDFIMVKAGHMKLTFSKRNGEIVNISGGGCPDIPFLALNMVGKTLEEADKPDDLGYTLCAYMLQKAYERALQTSRKNS